MPVEYVDQRDIQRRGGKCARYPTSCLVVDMIEKYVGKLDGMWVADITYGEGRFWAVKRPGFLFGSDIKRREWIVKPDVFHELSVVDVYSVLKLYGDGFFDLGIVDPPWGRRHRRRKHFNASIEEGERILRDGLDTLRRVRVKYSLVHFKYPIEAEGWNVVHDVRFLFFSRHIKQKGDNYTWFAVLELSE